MRLGMVYITGVVCSKGSNQVYYDGRNQLWQLYRVKYRSTLQMWLKDNHALAVF